MIICMFGKVISCPTFYYTLSGLRGGSCYCATFVEETLPGFLFEIEFCVFNLLIGDLQISIEASFTVNNENDSDRL